jgi:hypothetical protein
MAFSATTVENLTTVTSSTTTAATNLFTPSGAEIGRYRLRVIRAVFIGATGGDSVTLTGITPTATTPETQTLALLVCTQSTGPAAAQIATVDSVSFPDEAEFRGRIQLANTLTTGNVTLFIHHG